MNARLKHRTLEDFRAANCKAASCEECETNRLCLPYCFFSACDENKRTDIEGGNGVGDSQRRNLWTFKNSASC